MENLVLLVDNHWNILLNTVIDQPWKLFLIGEDEAAMHTVEVTQFQMYMILIYAEISFKLLFNQIHVS